MARPDKFGSPYDPRNGMGKIQRESEQTRREREQHRLRGCGDPGCAICNPETAAQGAGRMASTSRPSSYVYDEAIRSALDNLSSSWLSFDVGSGTASAAKSGVPAAFTQAREAVKQWLIKAPDQSFDDIVGNDEALGQLRDAVQAPVNHKELYEAYGMKMPRGALLSGPPGCGKTMFARAAASEMKRLYGGEVEFISLSGAELQTMYVGETEKHIKSLFTFAREYKALRGHPLLIFIDEAEVILPDRTGRVRRVAPWEESQVATFLAEMDGMQESGAFVLLATNRPEVIDQAVLRDGRCDFKIAVARPNQLAVETILQKNFAGILLGSDPVESLVFAALESLYDPHRVLIEAHAMRLRLKEEGLDLKLENLALDVRDKHFLLEHIVSGAMAASIPNRAKRYAFARDKETGVARGVLAADVVKAVNDLFSENKGLDHAFALEEFKRDFLAELNGAGGGE